jgi:hypothetical protein
MQSLVFALALARPKRHDGSTFIDDREDLPLDALKAMGGVVAAADPAADAPAPAAAAVSHVPPRWIPLQRGGGIFANCKSLGICTPDLEVANYWFDRIVDAAEKYKFHLKVDAEGDAALKNAATATAEERRAVLREQCFFEMTPEHPDRFFSFAGVDWFHDRFRVAADRADLQQAAVPGLQSERSWSGRQRELVAVLEKVLWPRFVAGKRLADDDDCSRSLSKINAEANGGGKASETIKLEGGAIVFLQQAWSEYLGQQEILYGV